MRCPRVAADPSVGADGDGPVLGHLRVVGAEFEPRLAARAGDVAGLVFFGGATALVQVDDVHATRVDYGECRSQGEPVNFLNARTPTLGRVGASTALVRETSTRQPIGRRPRRRTASGPPGYPPAPTGGLGFPQADGRCRDKDATAGR